MTLLCDILPTKAEEALSDGLQLREWCMLSDSSRGLTPFALDLKTKFRLENRAEGYFGSLLLNGTPTS